MTFEPEFERQLDIFIENALLEDAPQGDRTSLACIPPDARCTANLLVKDAGILAGVEVARRIFEKTQTNCRILQSCLCRFAA